MHKVGRNRDITYTNATKSYRGPVATLFQAPSELEVPHWQVLGALPAALPTLLLFHISTSETQMEAGTEEADSRKQTRSDQNSAHQQLFYWSMIATRLSPTEASEESHGPIGILQLKQRIKSPWSKRTAVNKDKAQREAEISPVALESLFYSNPTVWSHKCILVLAPSPSNNIFWPHYFVTILKFVMFLTYTIAMGSFFCKYFDISVV